jgi:hypothetical protein
MRIASRPIGSVSLCAAAAAASVLLAGLPAQAQSIIKRPGDHPKYVVELEPHGLVQYASTPTWMGSGFGLGFRASIPFLDNGPISTINNNMAISFGVDWAHFSEDWWCAGRFGPGDPRWPGYAWNANWGCTANTLWFPVVLQWNFFLTDIISVFGEPGLALVYDWWNWWVPCGAPGGACESHPHDVYLAPAFWGGARFLFGKTVGLTVRLGYPSATLGLSILL